MTHERYSLPLVIAVTGHRDLLEAECPEISKRIGTLFDELQSKYPDTPLCVMSPLAEGADILVAEVAIEKGIELIVPLPKPKEDYLADFKSEDNKKKFKSLCQQASDVFELRFDQLPVPGDIHPDRWASDSPYVNLGIYLSAHCHMLIAIWDGNPSEHLGGTAQVVRFHQDDIMPGLWPTSLATQKMLIDDESDLVFHIVCSRKNKGHSPAQGLKPLDWFWFSKDEDQPYSKELPAQHEFIFQQTAEFSQDAQRFAQQIHDEAYSLMPEPPLPEMPEGLKRIDHLFSIADWLAIHYQKKTLRRLRAVHLLVFLMGFMFILYSDFESNQIYLFVFLALFTVAAAMQYYAKRNCWQRKHLDYRTLAEGLRVQFYWAAAGVISEHRWKFAHDAYLQNQNPEFGWIRNVMRVAGIHCDAWPKNSTEGIQFANAEWVGDTDSGQLSYFRAKANERIRMNRLTELLGRISLAISVLVVFIFLFWGGALDGELADILTVIMGVSLLLFGVREGYAYATAIKELIKQYEFMLRIYDNAYKRLSQTKDEAQQRQILLALGQSALDEHADWILMHRERSLDEGEIWRMGS